MKQDKREELDMVAGMLQMVSTNMNTVDQNFVDRDSHSHCRANKIDPKKVLSEVMQ
ncbi:unnamed protein product, partial [marine sediment metagenome]